MKLVSGNLLRAEGEHRENEVFEDLLRRPGVRIERIVSRGQTKQIYLSAAKFRSDCSDQATRLREYPRDAMGSVGAWPRCREQDVHWSGRQYETSYGHPLWSIIPMSDPARCAGSLTGNPQLA